VAKIRERSAGWETLTVDVVKSTPDRRAKVLRESSPMYSCEFNPILFGAYECEYENLGILPQNNK